MIVHEMEYILIIVNVIVKIYVLVAIMNIMVIIYQKNVHVFYKNVEILNFVKQILFKNVQYVEIKFNYLRIRQGYFFIYFEQVL